MADNLQPVGVSAVIEHLNDYLKGADQLQRATDGMAKGVDNAAKSTQKGGDAVGQFGKDAARAAKDAEGFGTHIGQLADKFGGLFLKLAPIGGAIAGAFAVGKGVQAANDLGAAIFRLQQTTNLSAEDASRLKFVFDETGVSFQQGERAIIKFSRALGGVADLEDGIAIPTGKGMADALFNLGIRTQDAEGATRPLTEVLADLADVFQKMPEGVEKTALATNLFGRNGKDLIPFLNEGRAGMEDLAKEADKLGLVLDQNTVNSIRQNELATKHFHAALEGISVQLGLIFLPALTLAIQVGTKLAVAFNQKVVPVMKIFNGLLNFQLQRFTTTFGPKSLKLFQDIGKAISVAGQAFLKGFVAGGLDLNGFAGKLKPFAAIFEIIGAAVRYSYDQMRTLIQFLRIAGEVIQAVVTDFTNLVRIADFLPTPLKDVAYWIFQIILKGKDLVQGLLNIGAKANEVSGGPLDKLRAIAERLGKLVIPVLGSAITVFLGVLAAGAIVGFVSALGGLASAFANFGPIKIFTDLIGDFIKGIGKTFKFVVDLAGDALEGVTAIGKFLLNVAGKAFSFVLDAAGTAIDFIRGFTSGFFQEFLDQHHLTQTIDVKTQPAAAPPGGPPVGTLKPIQQPPGLLDRVKQLANDVGAVFQAAIQSNFVTSISAALLAAAIEAPTSIATLLGFQQLGSFLADLVTGGFAIALAENLPKVLRVTAITTILIGAIETLVNVLQGEFKQAGFRLGFAFGGAIIGGLLGLLGGPFAEITVPAGAVAGAAIGIALADALTLIFGTKVIDAFAKFFGTTLPHFLVTVLRKIPGFLGTILGAVGGALAVAIVGGLIILPALAVREFIKLEKFLFRTAIDVGRSAAEGLVRGLFEFEKFMLQLQVSIVKGLADIGVAILRILASLPGRIVDEFRDIPDQIEAIIKAVPRVFDFVLHDLPDITANIAVAAVKAMIDEFKALPDQILAVFKGAYDALNALTRGALGEIIDAIVNFGLGVVRGFKDVWNSANDATDGALNDTVTTIADKFTTILDDLDRFRGAVIDIFKKIAGGIQAAFDGITGIATSAFDTIKNGILVAVHAIATTIAGVLQDINDTFDAVSGLPGVEHFQNQLQAFINLLRGIGGSATSSPSGGFSQQDINALGGPVQGFAGGTNGPLPGATFANVAENGMEVAFLGRGRALLPAGTEILPANISAALLSLPALARSGGSGSVSIAMPFEINGSQINLDDVRAMAHRVLDDAFSSARSRVTRRGVPLTSEIG